MPSPLESALASERRRDPRAPGVVRPAPFVLAVALTLWAQRSYACAVCSTSDATLSVKGTEQPFVGRTRVSVDGRAGTMHAGGYALVDRRAEAGASYAPHAQVLFGMYVPMLVRDVAAAGSATSTRVLGDIELRLAASSAVRRVGFARQQFGLLFDLGLPTAPAQRGANGEFLPSTMQPGCNSVVPAPGFFYRLVRAAWSFYTSAHVTFPMPVRQAPHQGNYLRNLATLQYQPMASFALRAGLDTRLEAKGETRCGDGQVDQNSGGLLAFAVAQIVVAPASDLVITGGVHAPLVQATFGDRRLGPIVGVNAAYDF